MRLKALPTLPPTRRTVIIAILPYYHLQQRSYSSPSSSATTPPERSISYLPNQSQPQSASPASATSTTAATPAPPPPSSALDQATSLFIRPRPKFLYSAPRFLNLPVNTRIPEVCILGRSNVGKSTLLNALSGLETHGRAGRSHGSKRNRTGIAITSATAGCTKTLNGYGFGPPMRLPPSQDQQQQQQPQDEDGGGGNAGRTTRSQRRDSAQRKEPPPKHSLVVMDMPGYGLHSREEWGAEIAKYLARRAMLRGAVVLVDSVAGVKDGDRLALELLRDAGVRTAVVLTKADKLVGRSGDEDEEALLRKRCVQVWEELRRVEKRGRKRAGPQGPGWKEGRGRWEAEIFVTGAGDPKGGGLGVAGARLAIARLAGLVEGQGSQVKVSNKGQAPLGTGKVVPFDQIQWAASPPEEEPRADLGVPSEEGIPESPVEAEQQPVRRGRVRPWRRQADTLDSIGQHPESRRGGGRASF